MTHVKSINWKLATVVPLIIFAACFAITFSAAYRQHPTILSNAILIDMLVLAPLAYYLIIRKQGIPKTTVLRVFILGVLLAGFILNTGATPALPLIKTWIAPLVEAAVIFFIIRKFYTVRKQAKTIQRGPADFLPFCRTIMCRLTGNEWAGNLIGSEIAVLYYAFRPGGKNNVDDQIRFSGYRQNGLLAVLGAILFLFIIETTGVHFLLASWNTSVAWIITGLSAYTCMQLFAHIRAVKARPITLTADTLYIYNGLAGDAAVPYALIEKIEWSKKMPVGDNAIKMPLLKDLENHNMIIHLKQPLAVRKIFGIQKQAEAVLFFVDNPGLFLEAVLLKVNGINS